ncbi:MAG: CPBP family intramembrane glutamic endopeptidase [Planctomycetota bacterium]|jgi:membrane protease YdiL (CAAX protease family)
MTEQNTGRKHLETVLKTCGILSPYLAVLLGLFYFKNAFVSVLLYHLLLLGCIAGINGRKAIHFLKVGFDGIIRWFCLCGLLPGIFIVSLWPIAKIETINLSNLFELVGLSNTSFCVFALYACLVNPFLEESFWRGCFKPALKRPGLVDILFGGYHAVIVLPVLSLPYAIITLALLTCVGWVFRNIYCVTGGLAIPLITHIIADIAILAAVWKIMQ